MATHVHTNTLNTVTEQLSLDLRQVAAEAVQNDTTLKSTVEQAFHLLVDTRDASLRQHVQDSVVQLNDKRLFRPCFVRPLFFARFRSPVFVRPVRSARVRFALCFSPGLFRPFFLAYVLFARRLFRPCWFRPAFLFAGVCFARQVVRLWP